MSAAPSKPWFAAKRHGYGASLPIAWQGWLALALMLAGVGAAGRLCAGWPRAGVIAILLAAFAGLCALKTEGGWRWRWGDRR